MTHMGVVSWVVFLCSAIKWHLEQFWYSISNPAEFLAKYSSWVCCFCGGLRSSLWLQFKPHHIAAGAAYLAAKLLNFDLAFYQNIWQEFETTPAILQDVSEQLMELF
ncbi:cyclin-T1-4-like isoform X1 [Populus nigra]|uniref:cyclin-T1-4-like isoform X1 n=1 Tax=Populus nigra TaxID=3691 RepID=UPI002B2792ED|nr:cyclin-T1-4-like isoform X1 [Populus nigra]